ncbi:MAG: tetratricopeptide repeat protein [Candidatus Latescibacteria bacterium]|nr:tetratricopeptide repeat protein [bacterium]MBD3424760.1 tetratricopeptide repeat protein [Candidatus Latescibacterota bacterium]
MKKCNFIFLIIVVLLASIPGCKSVETTSSMLHNQAGEYDKAIEMAELGLEKDPQDAEAYFQLGIAYSYKGEMKKAYKNYMKAKELAPNAKGDLVETNIQSNWAKHYNNGLNEYQLDNKVGAVKEFEKACNADPRRIKSWLNYANISFTLANDPEAGDSTYFDKAYMAADTLQSIITKEDEDYLKVLPLVGKIKASQGKIDDAIKSFEELISEKPTETKPVERTAEMFYRREDWATAAKLYEVAARGYEISGEENPSLYTNMGVVYSKMKRYHNAVRSFSQAQSMAPENKQIGYSLLVTYYQAKLWDEAIMFGEEYTTKIAPNDPNGWQILSRAYKEKGLKIKAEETYKRFVELRQAQGG